MEDIVEGLRMSDIQYTVAEREDLQSLEAFLSQREIDEFFVTPLSQRSPSIEQRVKDKFEKGHWFLAKGENGAILGCVALIPHEDKGEVEVSTFAVSPKMQGHGIGSRLISMTEDAMPQYYPNYRTLILDSWEGNEAIEALMRKYDFRFRTSFPDPDKRPEGVKTVIYEKDF